MKFFTKSLLLFAAFLLLFGCTSKQTMTQSSTNASPGMMEMNTDKDGMSTWVPVPVLFDFDKDVIKPEAYPILINAAKFLKENYKINIELHGHCDNHGAEAYNENLSLRRANAVKTYLNSKGVVMSRMKIKGFGFSKPVASNDSASGRAKNRRVEIHPMY